MLQQLLLGLRRILNQRGLVHIDDADEAQGMLNLLGMGRQIREQVGDPSLAKLIQPRHQVGEVLFPDGNGGVLEDVVIPGPFELQGLLSLLALGDVLPGPQDADDLPRSIVHGNLVRLDPDGSAVGQRRRFNDAKLGRIGTHHLAVLGDEEVRLLARQSREVAIVFADNLLGDFESKGTSDHAIAPQIP